LGRLSAGETADYIRHRIGVAAIDGAAGDGLPHFTPEAAEAIHKATKGTPRLINSLCDNALLMSYARSRREITAGTIESVLSSMTFWSAGPAEADPQADTKQAPRQQGQPAEPAPPPQDPARPSHAADPPPTTDDPGPAEAACNNPASPAEACPPAAGPVRNSPVSNSPVPNGQDTDDSHLLLGAALLGEPSREMARRVYRTAPAGSEAQHLALRILAREVLATMRAGT
jgi:hypothetical protein